jgi:hypothetical protein
MEAYITTIIMASSVEGDEGKTTVCEEQIRLIRATSRSEAYRKAIRIGLSEEHSYKNANDATVYWRFLGLENLEQLSQKNLRDGQELRSRYFRHPDPTSLTRQQERLSVFLERHPLDQQEDPSVIGEKLPIDEQD